MKKYLFAAIMIALASVLLLLHTANTNVELRPIAIKYALFVSISILVLVVAGLIIKLFKEIKR